MPKRLPESGWVPPLYHDRAHNRGRVRFPGERDVGCGRWPADQKDPPLDVRARYHQLIAEWQARERQPAERRARALTPPLVSQLVEAFLLWADGEYRKRDGKHDAEWYCYRALVPILLETCGNVKANDFGPGDVVKLQKAFLTVRFTNKVSKRSGRWSRGYINEQIARVRRIWNWGVGQGLVQKDVAEGIGKAYVRPLKKRKTEAPETVKRRIPGRAEVWATAEALHEPLRTMVKAHWLIGCRANQVVNMRPREIEAQADNSCWLWRPSVDKLEDRDPAEEASYWIGPQAQALLRPLLDQTAPDAYLFPVDARGRRQFGPGGTGAYSKDSYNAAVQRAVRRLRRSNPGLLSWSVGTIRHGRATEIRAAENLAGRHGREGASAVLGHEESDTTIRYAQKRDIAQRVQAEMG